MHGYFDTNDAITLAKEAHSSLQFIIYLHVICNTATKDTRQVQALIPLKTNNPMTFG